MKVHLIKISLICILAIASGVGIYFLLPASQPVSEVSPFDGQSAWQDVAYQVSLGPRIPGSQAHADFIEWILDELEGYGWQAAIQEAEMMGHLIENIYATRNDENPQILLVAHYDSRLVADRDPDPAKQSEPVPGANDGASGVAVLLELARTLPSGTVPVGLLFTDAEDNGNIPGWDWALGAQAFVIALEGKPQSVIVIDMIGDADLKIYKERNSDPAITESVWAQASKLGYQDIFVNEEKHSIIDDHLPFLAAGIPAIDIIDIDYPYWHTTADTPDKVSPASLQVVGKTLWHWVVNHP
jgi:hypothetical protein